MHVYKRLIFIGKDFIESANYLNSLHDINLFIDYKQALEALEFLHKHDMPIDLIIIDADRIISSLGAFKKKLAKYLRNECNIIFVCSSVKTKDCTELNIAKKPIDAESLIKYINSFL